MLESLEYPQNLEETNTVTYLSNKENIFVTMLQLVNAIKLFVSSSLTEGGSNKLVIRTSSKNNWKGRTLQLTTPTKKVFI
jgi:hypothetical protein